MSPDPLTIHGLGADPNVYAYVSGQALKATDPLGLEGAHGESHPSSSGMDTPMENVGTNGAPSSFMEMQPEAIAAENAAAETMAAQRAQVEADFAAFNQGRAEAEYIERAQSAGRQVAVDGTPQLQAEAERAKAAHGLGIMLETTPFAAPVVTLQALTGSNDVGVVANHVGMIVGSGAYRLAPPRVTTSSAPAGSGTGLKSLVTKLNPQGFEDNCGSVAIALDRTFAGAPTSSTNTGVLFPSQVAEVYGNLGFASFPSVNSISQYMSRAGPGSRGIVYANRGETAHYFNVFNQRGSVQFIDGTTGEFADTNGYLFFQMMRTH